MEKFQKNKYRFSSIKPLVLITDEVIELRSQQIAMLISDLLKYKVLLRDLLKDDVSYSIRNELLNIAMFISNDIELYDRFIKEGDIPVDKIRIEARVDSKYINKYRDYIIVYTLILGNPDYKNLQDYIEIAENTEEDLEKDIIEYEEKNGVDGIVLESSKKNAIVMTSLGEFKKLKFKGTCFRGEEIKSVEKKSLKDYKLYASIVSIFALIFVLSIVYKYNNVVSMIVVDTTSQIKLEINGFNRVLNVSASNEKGTTLITETCILDNNLDEALVKIIEYANENEMLKDSGTVITITGEALKHNSLEKTSEFVYKKDLKVRLNNDGSEHRLNYGKT